MKNIGLWIDNLMDRVRIGDHLKKSGFQIINVPDAEACFRFLQSKSGFVIIDLQNASLDFEKTRNQFSTQPELAKLILAYFPHVQIHLKKGAEQCGISHIYPRSVFFNDPVALIRKVIENSEL